MLRFPCRNPSALARFRHTVSAAEILDFGAQQVLACLVHRVRSFVTKVQKTLKQTVASDMEPKLGAPASGIGTVCAMCACVPWWCPHNQSGSFHLALKASAEVAGSPAHPEENSQRRQATSDSVEAKIPSAEKRHLAIPEG